MGLDVYLYQYFDKAKADKMEAEHEKRSEAIWGKACNGRKYEELTDAEKDAVRAEIVAMEIEIGMVKNEEYNWYSIPDTLYREAEVPESKVNPDHMFKLNYLRSSYNDGGVNRVAEVATGKYGLYWVFDREDGEEYCFQPDWEQAHGRALQLAREMEENASATGGDLVVLEATANMFSGPAEIVARCSSKEDALKLYKKEWDAHSDAENQPFGSGGYSNNIGEFYHHDPLQLVGIVHGGTKDIMASLQGSSGFKPATYLICRGSDDRLKSYTESLRITAEMCEWVMKQDNPDQFWLHWSA